MAWDMKGALAEVQRALEIEPNSATARLFLALHHTCVGNFNEGLSEMRRAVQLDPLSPIIGNFEVLLDVANNRLDDAFAAAKRTMEIDPDYVYFEPNLALVYREQGKLKQALEIYERLAKTRNQPTAGLAITYARLDRKEEARRILRQLIDIATSQYFPADQIASVYIALGEKDEAFRWLDRAIAEHSGPIHAIAFTREFRPLRSDPRFTEVLRRIGIEPEKMLDRQ
jgi:tetratricopeptide (TPR) repeat protein